MMLYYCVFAIILTKLGCLGNTWGVIDDFRKNIDKYSTTREEMFHVIDRFLREKRSDSEQFLRDIDNTPYVERSELRPRCSLVHQRLEGLIYSFKKNLLKLETPLINFKIEMKDRLSDIFSALDVYQRIADNRHKYCTNNLCVEQILQWLREKLGTMQCRVNHCGASKNVSTTVRYKRSSCDGFKCKNDTCIPHDKVCNGEMDCLDGSDETPQCERYCFNGFHCKDLRCIDKSKVCDGVANCDDKSDEENCKQSGSVLHSIATCNVETGNFYCSNKHCVPLAEICDGIDNCGDGSDEGPKCGEEAKCSPGCTASGGVCFMGSKGPLCVSECPEGTADDQGTCRQGAQRSPQSLEGLFEQLPYLLERYVSAVWYLKKRFIVSLDRAVVGCQGPSKELGSMRIVAQTSQ